MSHPVSSWSRSLSLQRIGSSVTKSLQNQLLEASLTQASFSHGFYTTSTIKNALRIPSRGNLRWQYWRNKEQTIACKWKIVKASSWYWLSTCLTCLCSKSSKNLALCLSCQSVICFWNTMAKHSSTSLMAANARLKSFSSHCTFSCTSNASQKTFFSKKKTRQL